MRTQVTPGEMNKRPFPGRGKMALNGRNWVFVAAAYVSRFRFVDRTIKVDFCSQFRFARD